MAAISFINKASGVVRYSTPSKISFPLIIEPINIRLPSRSSSCHKFCRLLNTENANSIPELATKGCTVKYRPRQLFHSEFFDTKAEAMKREKQLKLAKGREFIWTKIKNRP